MSKGNTFFKINEEKFRNIAKHAISEAIEEYKDRDSILRQVRSMRSNILDLSEDGYGILYVDYDPETNELFAGDGTNAGIIPQYSIEYDNDFSLDENLQALVEEIYNSPNSEEEDFDGMMESCSPKHFKEIKYFSTDGSSLPNGIGFQRGNFLRECRLNSEAFVLDEAVHDKQYGLADYKGGIIVFSTDVNAVQLDKNKIMNWLKQHIKSFVQKHSTGKILHNVVSKFNKYNETEEFIGAYSVGNSFKGKYVGDNGEEYKESSTTIEVNGISSEALLRLAEMVARVFGQETVLVKDFNSNKFYLANGLRREQSPDLSKINTKNESRNRSRKNLSEVRGWDLEKDDVTWVNEKEDGVKPWMVRIWPGSGYILPAFAAYANYEEDALEKVVAFLEKTNDNRFFCEDYVEDFKQELAEEGKTEEEIDEEINNQFCYVDATMDGAQEPHYLFWENLNVYPYDEKRFRS